MEVAELEEQQERAAVGEAARGLAEFVARVFESGLSVGGSQKVRSCHEVHMLLKICGKIQKNQFRFFALKLCDFKSGLAMGGLAQGAAKGPVELVLW